MRAEICDNREMKPLNKDCALLEKLSDDLKDSVEIVLSAFKAHRNPHGYAYLSMPITSGKLFYEVLDKHGAKTIDDLTGIVLYDEIIRPNIDTNTRIADEIADLTKKTIIAPAVFEAKKQRWPQEAYMYLWYRVLEEVVDETLMTDGWEYSNGGVQEYVRSHEIKYNFVLTSRHVVSGLPSYLPRSYWPTFKDKKPAVQYVDTMEIRDINLEPLPLHKGAHMISDAIVDLIDRGFDPKKLMQSLREIGGLSECHEHYKDGWLGQDIKMPWTIDHNSVYDSIRKVTPGFRSCKEYVRLN